MDGFEKFVSKFDFQERLALKIGVERECFLSRDGVIAPISAEVLNKIGENNRFGYELSACQLEERVGPCEITELHDEFAINEIIIRQAETELNFKRLYVEVAPDDIPLDVYPDPAGRYQQIAKSMSRDILLAACQVTGVHIHIGMASHDTAIRAYNEIVDKAVIDKLCSLGDKSNGRRLEIYRKVAPDFYPPKYRNFKDFYEAARKKGFLENPRNCWNIVRISIHGTIEFRMFGSTADINEIIGWAASCLSLCENAFKR